MSYKEIPVSEIDPSDFDDLEFYIARAFRDEIYLPMIRELNQSDTVLNDLDSLRSAIQQGTIYFYRGKFKGNFNAKTTKELKALGAKFNRWGGYFEFPSSKLPQDLKTAIGLSESMLQRKMQKLNDFLSKLDPAKIAGKMKIEKLFDSLLFKAENKFEDSLKSITVAPRLTPERIERITKEYTKNLELSIVDWTTKETAELRLRMQEHVFSGRRFEGIISEIQHSYGVSQSKAKFLARQESNLLLVKYNQSRYQDSGVNEYKWRCFFDSAAHPVRHMHKIHNGKIFTWDNPPITDEQGNRKNPGQDYNCRCKAVPIVRF